MTAKVGSAVVTCPGCGESFVMGVYLHSTEFKYGNALVATFTGSRSEHTCEGRD